MKVIVSILFSLLIPSSLLSQDTSNEHTIEVYKVHSSRTNIDYDLLISGTRGKPELPVLYVLDPDYYFLQFLLSYDSLLRQGEVREALIVGVGYGQNFLKREYGVLRDLTPTAMDPKEYNENIAVIPRDSALAHTGGADAFVDFLKEKVFPFVHERFQTSNERIVFGNGYAGLFLCDLLGKEASLFTAYIISNPSLWWNNESLVKGAAVSPPRTTKIFFSLGLKQEKKITAAATHFMTSIKAEELITRSFPGEDGLGSIPLGFSEGCKTILRKD